MKNLIYAVILITAATTCSAASLTEQLQSSFNQKKNAALEAETAQNKKLNTYGDVFLNYSSKMAKYIPMLAKDAFFYSDTCKILFEDEKGLPLCQEKTSEMRTSVNDLKNAKTFGDIAIAWHSYDSALSAYKEILLLYIANSTDQQWEKESETYLRISKSVLISRDIFKIENEMYSAREAIYLSKVISLLEKTVFPESKVKEDLYNLYYKENSLAYPVSSYLYEKRMADTKTEDFYKNLSSDLYKLYREAIDF
ncbi:hypothetical protein AAIR98_001010 [Elusimicrobium simillimum]|uniref:hypothetical protein n=1 Tax=Elusimicrobium simillimum TaxID=3143438 RepID=UPI003C6ED523